MSASATPQDPIRDGQEILARSNRQQWPATWHPAGPAPDGKRHGSAGICVTPDRHVVLITEDNIRWGLPAGRPEGDEDWEQTLRREMLEEACAIVREARLLGFIRARCIQGHEEGPVVVRAFWQADVDLQPWDPKFEIRDRRLVPVADLLSHLAEHDADFLPVNRRH